MGNLTPLDDAVARARRGLQVELGGDVPGAPRPHGGTGELVGIVVALVVLVLALGSVVGAGLPIGTALVGLGIGSVGITLLAALIDVSTAAPWSPRWSGWVSASTTPCCWSPATPRTSPGPERRQAAGRATATAGRSVVVAASTVLVSLIGLRLAGLPVLRRSGSPPAIVVRRA